ncbi:MAG: hypothetical protein QCI00_01770 [Candidatus Thermoplasmatota archaeon]|nr:hypothetical protein [Candidatus Thermoplasmatota archaeon]
MKMNIGNIQLKSIEARRYIDLSPHPTKIRIDHNSNINRMEIEKENTAKVEFQYTASYTTVGMIKIEGSLLYHGENSSDLVKQWNDTRKMPDAIASAIHTAIMHSCVPQAVGIAKDLRLPPPIPLPQVRLGKDPKKGQAGSGPEVA